MIEFVAPDKALKTQEATINKALRERFPDLGPVQLLATEDGEIAVKMTLLARAGAKGRLDEAYRFVMAQLGEARGRRPGEPRVQVKYHLPPELHRRVKEAARQAKISASDWVTAYLKERLG